MVYWLGISEMKYHLSILLTFPVFVITEIKYYLRFTLLTSPVFIISSEFISLAMSSNATLKESKIKI